MKFFAIGQFWLVGLVGQKTASATLNIQPLFRGLQMNLAPNLNQIGWKPAKLAQHEIFPPDGWSGRSALVKPTPEFGFKLDSHDKPPCKKSTQYLKAFPCSQEPLSAISIQIGGTAELLGTRIINNPIVH